MPGDYILLTGITKRAVAGKIKDIHIFNDSYDIEWFINDNITTHEIVASDFVDNNYELDTKYMKKLQFNKEMNEIIEGE